MVGRRVVVVEAIVNGRGKVKVGDGQWLVEGPDVAVGSEVEIVSVQGTTFTVKPVA
jgi:membrane protein implicated in regulation of membrane protease activity